MKKTTEHMSQIDSLKETRKALIATGLTLLAAVLIYQLMPNVQNYLLAKHTTADVTRIFTSTPQGGTIQYKPIKEGADVERAVLDLSILSRRFERGDFEILNIPGSRHIGTVAAMTRYDKSFTYSVEKNGDGAILKIETRNPAAKRALDEYLAFLTERWKN